MKALRIFDNKNLFSRRNMNQEESRERFVRLHTNTLPGVLPSTGLVRAKTGPGRSRPDCRHEMDLGGDGRGLSTTGRPGSEVEEGDVSVFVSVRNYAKTTSDVSKGRVEVLGGVSCQVCTVCGNIKKFAVASLGS